MQNGKYDLDLTDALGERLKMKAGDYTFSLPADMPMTQVAKVGRALSVLGKAMQADGADDTIALEQAEADLWAVAEQIMSQAEPQPSVAVRELFTTTAMTGLLTFLLGKFNEATRSMTSSPSPISSTAPSLSANSSQAEPSTTAPAG